MLLVIWRLPHPVRGLVAFLIVFAVGSRLVGFGMGLPEFAVLALLAGAAFVVASTSTSGDSGYAS